MAATSSAPRPSSRLVRAAAAERSELARHCARLEHEAAELRRTLARIETGLAEIAERRALLDQLAPPDRGGADPAPIGRSAAATRSTHGAAAPGLGAPELLRGPAIRIAAVRVLRTSGHDGAHYRQWFALLTDAGYAVAGKDPLAVFLTQLGRSPAIRKGDAAGEYELDLGAPARARETLAALQAELRELTGTPAPDFAVARARRERLTAEIGRAERALEELQAVLGSD